MGHQAEAGPQRRGQICPPGPARLTREGAENLSVNLHHTCWLVRLNVLRAMYQIIIRKKKDKLLFIFQGVMIQHICVIFRPYEYVRDYISLRPTVSLIYTDLQLNITNYKINIGQPVTLAASLTGQRVKELLCYKIRRMLSGKCHAELKVTQDKVIIIQQASLSLSSADFPFSFRPPSLC